MKTSATRPAAIGASAALSVPPGGRAQDDAPEQGVVAPIMPAKVRLLTCLAILVAATSLATLVVFPVSMAIAAIVEAVRCAVSAGSTGFAAHLAAHVVPLAKVSVVSALILAPCACAAFVADLRRQRWL